MESPLRCPSEPDFRLIETFGYRPGQGVSRLDLHLSRMARSAAALGIDFDRQRAGDQIAEISGESALRCRLTLSPSGDLDITTAPLTEVSRPWVVGIAQVCVQSGDPWLQHKTTRRQLYDQARANLPNGVDELLFLNEQGDVCEGTITNVFLTLSSGLKVTPPLSSGLLPGVLRQQMLQTGKVAEQVVTEQDLSAARSIAVGNSLRGLIPSKLLGR